MISNIKLNIYGIHKILNNLQNKHINARYNPDPFEKTNLLAFCVEHSKKKKSVFTNLNQTPDVNFGINSITYVIIDKNDKLNFGVLNHKKVISNVNKLYTEKTSDETQIIKKEKNKVGLDIDLDFNIEKGNSIIIFINFYHFLDKDSDITHNVNLKLTCYMARFYDIQTSNPSSFLQKISKKHTKYFTHSQESKIKSKSNDVNLSVS